MPIVANGKYYLIKANGKYYDIVNPFAMYTLIIVPAPADATVTLTAQEYSQVGNSITVRRGTVVNWTVSKNNYFTQSGSITVDRDTTQAVSLVYALATLYINPVPSDATVVLTADGYTQIGNSITVEKGTSVSWSVSKSGYITQTGNKQVNNDESLDIELVLDRPLYYCYKSSTFDACLYSRNEIKNIGSYQLYPSWNGPVSSSSELTDGPYEYYIYSIVENGIAEYVLGVFYRSPQNDLYT